MINKSNLTKPALLLFITLLGILSSSACFSNEDDLTLGVFPRTGLTETMRNFSPLANYLSKKLNRNVKLEVTKNYSTFWDAVKNKKYDIVHYNQYHYVRSHHESGYQVIAKNEENGKSNISGIIITHINSGIESLSDLRNKAIIFGGGRMAMQSYIIPTFLLQKANLKRTDYTEKFTASPVNAILAVYYGSVPAAGTGDAALYVNNVNNRIDQSQIKILARGDALTHLPWAVKESMASDLRLKIQQLLINMDKSSEGMQVLQVAELTGIKKVSDSQYDKHRIIIKAVLGESY